MIELAVGIYLAIGGFLALVTLKLLKEPPEHDPEWELFRTAFFASPEKSGLILFGYMVLAWPLVMFGRGRR